MTRRLTIWILTGLFLGIAVGTALHHSFPEGDATLAQIADTLKLLPDVFLHLIKMIIAPLVFTTLVAGIAHMEDAAAVGRIGAKTMGWFICASIVSLLVGLLMVHLLEPGAGPSYFADDIASVPIRSIVTLLVALPCWGLVHYYGRRGPVMALFYALIVSWVGFIATRRWAGTPSYRRMQQNCGNRCSATSFHTALSQDKLPKLPLVEAFIIACGGTDEEYRRWATAWRRLELGGGDTPTPASRRPEP